MKTADDLSGILRPVIEKMGYIYWGLQFQRQRRRCVLRIYIDHPEGIGVGDCCTVSDQLNCVLDVEDAIRQSYILEVSSPGVERLLFNSEHYASYIGAKVEVKSYTPLNDRKNFIGYLEAATEQSITLRMVEEAVDIPHSMIRRCRLRCEDWDYCGKEDSNGK